MKQHHKNYWTFNDAYFHEQKDNVDYLNKERFGFEKLLLVFLFTVQSSIRYDATRNFTDKIFLQKDFFLLFLSEQKWIDFVILKQLNSNLTITCRELTSKRRGKPLMRSNANPH